MARRRSVGPGVSFFAFQDIITAVVGIFILVTLILVLELAQRVETAGEKKSANVSPLLETIANLESEVQDLREKLETRSKQLATSSEVNQFNREETIATLKNSVQSSKRLIEQVHAEIARLNEHQGKTEHEFEGLLAQASDLGPLKQDTVKLNNESQEFESHSQRLSSDSSEIYRSRLEDGRFLVLITVSRDAIKIKDSLTRSQESFVGGDRADRVDDWLALTPLNDRHVLVLVEPGGASEFRAIKSSLKKSRASFGYSVVETQHSVLLEFEAADLK
ncbi:hypothetical protein SV7mr_18940 [Stieleria bergensis]|uniref:Uncharacterized protein n=1 Tax=Stieleria bergensis TaxID=2528025 RepID=A0A517STD9_9BACT|nr:hypothetical protein SV7mr_18940 [Planctomycetes bacterium SV_7m_r]